MSNKICFVLLGMIFVFLFLPAIAEETLSQKDSDWIEGPTKGPWRRLFLDAMVVEQSNGLQKVFHPVQKYEGNPVLRGDKPYETAQRSSGPYIYGTVMRDQGLLRMWYHLIHDGAYCNAYAESQDGIQWVKPDLGLVEFEGSTKNNLFMTLNTDPHENPPSRSRGQCHNPNIIRLPERLKAKGNYALFCYGSDWGTPRVAYSPDGLHWAFEPETAQKAMFPSSDVIHFFFDPYQDRFVATRKLGSRRGRTVGVAFSKDGINWTLPAEGPVFVPDDLDPDDTQIYGMPVFPYQGMYIGLPWIYHARYFKYGEYSVNRLHDAQKNSPRTVDVQLAWSWDLMNWTRSRSPLFQLGDEGAWDSIMIYTDQSPIVMGNELWFYYGGFNNPHDAPGGDSGQIGLATLRIDGFCSMRAEDQEGWLITRREPLKRPAIRINAKVDEGGYLLAEILDEEDRVLDGFSRNDCVPFKGDSISHPLRWRSEQFSKSQIKGDKKIRFILSKGDLFSYIPE